MLRLSVAKTTLRKKDKVGGPTLPDSRIHSKATLVNIVWCQLQGRQTDQWNRVEIPEINPSIDRQLTFNKDTKAIQWEKNSFYNKWSWDNWISKCKTASIHT